jgi:hypothetical protein
MKSAIMEHLEALKQEFGHYFLEVCEAKQVQMSLARNQFKVSVETLTDDIQKEFLEMVEESSYAVMHRNHMNESAISEEDISWYCTHMPHTGHRHIHDGFTQKGKDGLALAGAWRNRLGLSC